MLEQGTSKNTRSAELDLVDAQEQIWDFVVIGTGAGGAPAGFNLARLGRSVLFIEQGDWFRSTNASPSACGEHWIRSAGCVEFCPAYLAQFQLTRPVSRLQIPVGRGVGGSTGLFGMVLERFRREDFEPHRFYSAPTESMLQSSWPIQYEELEPYYEAAEQLFRVRGTNDILAPSRRPLLSPLPESEAETFVREALDRCGLHPYRMHYACEHIAGCNGCFHTPCANQCRNDAGRTCVRVALEHHGAHILTKCRVERLEAQGRTVRAAVCVQGDSHALIRGRTFVLALHALFTPLLLLCSANDLFPAGLGNSSGLLGRNLMLHVSDSFLLRLTSSQDLLNKLMHHGLSFNDFYVSDGLKLGNVHSHALDFSSAFSASRPIRPDGSALFHTIVEDFPYPDNRLLLTPGRPSQASWIYLYPEELWRRSQILLQKLAEKLRSTGEVIALRPSGNLNLGHACGTCRFGDNPRESVLDRDNRMHDLDNVFVVDGSFLPTSGGINPSLTIIANSLRVSDKLARS